MPAFTDDVLKTMTTLAGQSGCHDYLKLFRSSVQDVLGVLADQSVGSAVRTGDRITINARFFAPSREAMIRACQALGTKEQGSCGMHATSIDIQFFFQVSK